jgi:hypothetical protein
MFENKLEGRLSVAERPGVCFCGMASYAESGGAMVNQVK